MFTVICNNDLMKKNKHTLRLQDLENISSETPDCAKIMTEVIGYNNFYIGRKYRFKKAFSKAYFLIGEARNIDPKNVLIDDTCLIKKPNSVDNITFRAMMELQSHLNNHNETQDSGKFIAKIIAIVCFSENIDKDYSSSSSEFQDFYTDVLNAPIWQMMGLYNWIHEDLERSNLEWTKRFMSVDIQDPDYELAGGNRMQQFNVISTIQILCSDFNCSYDEAWQMSYLLTQTNSYKKATQNHIQDQMRIVKEAKMKKSRGMT